MPVFVVNNWSVASLHILDWGCQKHDVHCRSSPWSLLDGGGLVPWTDVDQGGGMSSHRKHLAFRMVFSGLFRNILYRVILHLISHHPFSSLPWVSSVSSCGTNSRSMSRCWTCRTRIPPTLWSGFQTTSRRWCGVFSEGQLMDMIYIYIYMCDIYINISYIWHIYIYTSSTAQGGGGISKIGNL